MHPRSCTTCHRRKTKCDRQSPCSSCKQTNFDCVYLSKPSARSKAKANSNVALKERLEKLENLVQGMSKVAAGDEPQRETLPVPYMDARSLINTEKVELGRLEIEEGESQYIENSFWVVLSNEVSDIKDLLDEFSDEDSDVVSPENKPSPSAGEQAYIYSFNSIACSLAVFHPTPGQVLFLWQVFVNQVDPVLRMLHKPTMRASIMNAKDNISEMGKPFEALLFAIYFASVTSMTEEQCRNTLQEEKDSVLSRYRFAAEQSLARAEFLSTHNIVTLQALIIFLICQRNHDQSRLVWTLTAVAIRIAQSLGIHRDGSNLKLPFFDAEMRRRVWWQICILDVRTAENHGSDQDVAQQDFDTKLPLNIDDEALVPGCSKIPVPPCGITEMSLPLMRYEIISVIWQLRSPPKPSSIVHGAEYSLSVVREIDRITDDCRKRLEHQFLKYCDMNVPVHWLIATVARMMLAKMWINVYHRYQLAEVRSIHKEHGRDRIFSMSLEIIDSCLLLERESSTQQWKWAFRNHVPWQALTFILSELCVRDQCETTDRAWTMVRSAFVEWADIAVTKGHDLLWLRMKRLLAKAQMARGLTDVSSTQTTHPRPNDSNQTASSGPNSYAFALSDARTDSQATQHDEYQWHNDDWNFPIGDDSFDIANSTTAMIFALGQNDGAAPDVMPFEAQDNWW